MMQLFSKFGIAIVVGLFLIAPAQAGPGSAGPLAIDRALSYEAAQGVELVQQFRPRRRFRRTVRRCVRRCQAGSPGSSWRFRRCVRHCVRRHTAWRWWQRRRFARRF